jgi:hypothetical protein
MQDSWYDGRMNPEWCGKACKDAMGRGFVVGDYVVRAITSGRTPNLEFSRVREIRNERVYLGESKTPIRYPSRLLIINELIESNQQPFICGGSDEVDSLGLPKYITVCPALGSDVTVTYEKRKDEQEH